MMTRFYLDSITWRSAVPLMMMMMIYLTLSGVESLQCFNCRGVSYYDPDSCFKPNRKDTVRQECARGEVCETRIHRVASFEKIIERGCTNACAGRDFIWTDYFQVYCCPTNECNTGNKSHLNIIIMLSSLLFTLFWFNT